MGFDALAHAVDASRQIFERARIERRRGRRRRAPQRLIHSGGDLFQPPFDRGQSGGRRRALDLRARFGERGGDFGRFVLRRRARRQTVDPIGEFADLLFKTIQRHRPLRQRAEKTSRLLGLLANAFECPGIDARAGNAVDFRADGADLALQRFDGFARIMGAQGFAQAGDEAFDRREEIVAGAVLAATRRPVG